MPVFSHHNHVSTASNCCPSSAAYKFFIDGKRIATVEEFPHLGPIITSTLDEKRDILAKRNSLCGKINNVLCYFNKCDPFVKLKLVRIYCSDFLW